MTSIILATAGYDHSIRLWEARSGYCYRTLQYPDSQVNVLEITPNKKYLAAAGNPHIKLFELTSNNPQAVSTFTSHKSNVTSIGFEKDGSFLYSGSEDGTIKIWDPRTPNFEKEFVKNDSCNTVELHPNQNDLISGYQSGNIRVFDINTGKCKYEFTLDEDLPIRSISLTSDGKKCCIATSKGECFIYKIELDEPDYLQKICSFKAHDAYLLKCTYSPDMKSLATASSDTTVKIWNTEDYSLSKVLSGHQRWVWDCAFSSASNYLVTGSSDHYARLWDIKDAKSIIQYSGHHKAIVCVALNDEGSSD